MEDVGQALICGQMADLIVNAGVGFGVGVVASVLLFRRESFLQLGPHECPN